ncbi:CLIP-associating protein 1 [Manis javanica]|nr:CLIP-associating protein 1 [Manis javanica]
MTPQLVSREPPNIRFTCAPDIQLVPVGGKITHYDLFNECATAIDAYLPKIKQDIMKTTVNQTVKNPCRQLGRTPKNDQTGQPAQLSSNQPEVLPVPARSRALPYHSPPPGRPTPLCLLHPTAPHVTFQGCPYKHRRLGLVSSLYSPVTPCMLVLFTVVFICSHF